MKYKTLLPFSIANIVNPEKMVKESGKSGKISGNSSFYQEFFIPYMPV